MQPTQNALTAFGVIILYEVVLTAKCLRQFASVIAFKKEATVVPKDLGFNKKDLGDS
jgi:hypothetical protein